MAEQPALTFERLLDWVEGRLTDQESTALQEQLSQADQSTLASLAWIQSFHRVSTELLIETPPAQLRSSLIERFAAAQRKPGLLQRISAMLSFDSTLQPAMSGARGVSDDQRRQLIFSSELADIALNLVRRTADQQLELSGQIFRKDASLAEQLQVRLMLAEQELASVQADDLGEFTFPARPADSYVIIVSDGTTEIVCGPL